MPVATSQKEAQLARTYSLLSSKPSASYSGRISPSLVSAASESLYTPESGALLSEMGQITNMPTNSNNDNTGHFFSTHSPPILNLSPNLSPVEHQRTSPGYDLRETARRRSIQGKFKRFCLKKEPSFIIFLPTPPPSFRLHVLTENLSIY
uniref:Uncharacterized protein n=1 Tax=Octopus bimaculoides TaxID=37653 RepID=A0A0L8GW25_OCTBM